MIERIDITYHQLPLDPAYPAAWDRRPRRRFPVTVVRVTDDSGAVGFGAGDPMRGVADYLDLFVGHDALELERHAEVLSNIAFHDGRPWPLDTALWDLAGKLEGTAMWRMVGAHSNRVRLYASSGTHSPPEVAAENALAAAERGFGGLKLRFGREELEDDFAVLEAVADMVPEGFRLLVDCNQGWRMPWDVHPAWDLRTASAVAARLELYGVMWVEEPLHRGDHRGMRELRSRTEVLVAGGEMTREVHEFDLLLDGECLDVFQPDVSVTGGMLALRDLARRVTDAGHVFTPHTWGSGVGLLANAHLTAGTVDTPFLEYPWDPGSWEPDRRDFLLTEPVLPDADGFLVLPDTPGLGWDLDTERLAATETGHVHYG